MGPAEAPTKDHGQKGHCERRFITLSMFTLT